MLLPSFYTWDPDQRTEMNADPTGSESQSLIQSINQIYERNNERTNDKYIDKYRGEVCG